MVKLNKIKPDLSPLRKMVNLIKIINTIAGKINLSCFFFFVKKKR